MSALGTMLQRAGLLSESQVASAREYAESHKLPFAEGVLELNLSDEDALVAFAASKLMIPRVNDKLLERIESQVTEMFPAQLAWTHLAMPVSVDAQRNLTVAMLDPTSIGAVKAIAEHTGHYIVRAVAPRAALRAAVERAYGPDRGAGFDPGATHPALHTPGQGGPLSRLTPPMGSAAASKSRVPKSPQPPQLGSPDYSAPVPPRRPPPISPSVVEEAKSLPPAPSSRPGTPRAWNPPLSGHHAEVVPLSAEALDQFLPQLQAADDRDAVTSAVLDYLAAGFGRVILFVHSREELRGHDARGADLLVDAVRLVRIPSTGKSMFSKAIMSQRPSFGPMGQSAIDRALSQALGGLEGNVLILPINLGTKVPLLVFAHGARNPVDPASVQTLAEETGNALLRLIQAKRKG